MSRYCWHPVRLNNSWWVCRWKLSRVHLYLKTTFYTIRSYRQYIYSFRNMRNGALVQIWIKCLLSLRSKRQNSPYIFSGSCIPTNESLFILLALRIHWQRQFKIILWIPFFPFNKIECWWTLSECGPPINIRKWRMMLLQRLSTVLAIAIRSQVQYLIKI